MCSVSAPVNLIEVLSIHYCFRREKGTTADHQRLEPEFCVLDPGRLLERGAHGQRTSPVLDQSAAVAVAGVHHPGRDIPLLHPGSDHRLLLLDHRMHHLAERTCNESRSSQILHKDKQHPDHDVPAQQLRG